MRLSRGATAVGVAILATACGGGSPTSAPPSAGSPTPAPPASPSPTPVSTPSPSASLVTTFTAGSDRPVEVIVPAAPTAGEPAPLVIILHGFGSNGAENQRYLGLGGAALERGVVLAFPDGTTNGEGRRFWNGTDACCDFEGIGPDDAGYLASLIDEIGAAVEVDPKRVYVMGHSNGGFMSYRMACEHADVVAAIASLAGATFATGDDCQPAVPVTILQIHGASDDAILYEGGAIDVGGPAVTYPGAGASAELWASYNGCERELVDSEARLDLDERISGPAGDAEATVRVATGCDPGGHVELWTIPGGSHVPSLSDTFGEDVLDFLLAHPKP